MKSVTGQFREYPLTKKIRSGPDGDTWLISGGEGEGICAKLTKGRSGILQSDVEASLQGAGNGSLLETPVDIVFSRGKFAGYIFYDAGAYADGSEPYGNASPGTDTAADSPVSLVTDSPAVRRDLSGSPAVRLTAAAAAIVLISALNIKVFHDIYLNLVASSNPGNVLTGCKAFSFSGVTAVIAGSAAAFFAGRLVKGADTAVFVGGISVGLLAGILAADVVILLLVKVFFGAVGLLMAVMPAVIVIAAVIYLIKKVLK